MTTPPVEQPLMAAEMAEQPAVLRSLIDLRAEMATQLRSRLREPPRGIALVGRGTSENAAQYGRIVLELATGVPAMLIPPSMGRLYGANTDYEGYFVIGISQSGYTPEIAETLQRAHKSGALTLALTSNLASPLAAIADFVFDLGTGEERATPATKTFTAELALLAIVAESIGVMPLTTHAWHEMAGAVDYMLADIGPVVMSASRLRHVEHAFILAAGASACLAHEAALKIMEAAGVAASGFSCESFRHGPVAIAGTAHPVIAIAPPGPAYDDVMRVCDRLPGVPTIVIGHGADIPIPGDLPESLAVIPAAVRIQQLALEMARRRGVNPDSPPHTQKVLAS